VSESRPNASTTHSALYPSFSALRASSTQFSDFSENRSKSARVRAISYQRMDPESGQNQP
jgi:hypothetical protein